MKKYSVIFSILALVSGFSANAQDPLTQNSSVETECRSEGCQNEWGPPVTVCTGDWGCYCGGSFWTNFPQDICQNTTGCVWTVTTSSDEAFRLAGAISSALSPACSLSECIDRENKPGHCNEVYSYAKHQVPGPVPVGCVSAIAERLCYCFDPPIIP